jgi:hypothetical protein
VDPVTSATTLVAVGGAYDGLLRALWPGAAPGAAAAGIPAPCACGTTVNLEKLVKVLGSKQRAAGGGEEGGLWGGTTLRPGGCEVLVAAKGSSGLLQQRMELVEQLWSAGIPAELLHRTAPSLTEQYEYAHARGVKWLVILDQALLTSSAVPNVKVKCLDKKFEDALVPLGDVVAYLELGIAGAQDPGRTMMMSSSTRGAAAAGGGGVGGGGVSLGGLAGAGSGSSSAGGYLHASGGSGGLAGGGGGSAAVPVREHVSHNVISYTRGSSMPRSTSMNEVGGEGGEGEGGASDRGGGGEGGGGAQGHVSAWAGRRWRRH